MTLYGTSLCDQLELDTGATGRWQEPRLSVTAAVTGARCDNTMYVETAQLTVASPSDQLQLQLVEPVAPLAADTSWLLSCTMRGQWPSWLQRVQPLLANQITTLGWSAAGPITAEATLRVSRQAWELERSSLKSAPFTWSSPEFEFHEPAMAIELEGSWDWTAQRVRIPQATFQSSALSFRINDPAQ